MTRTLRSRVAAALFAAALCMAPARASAQAPPALTAPVNDFADVIDAENEARLDRLIRALQTASGDVLVVATVKTFQPAADIRTYAAEMFENHGRGIGQKGRDNGLLLLLAVDDRQVWAEVGYDLEGIITDGYAGATSRDTMAPLFRQGDFGGGLVAGLTSFASRIAESRGVTLDGVPAPRAVQSRNRGGLPVGLLILGFIIINMLGGLMRRLTGGRRGRRSRWGSAVGPFGAGLGGWSSHGGGWSGGGGFGGGFGGFGGGRSGGGGGGASW
jgi:uncharacterized protein